MKFSLVCFVLIAIGSDGSFSNFVRECCASSCEVNKRNSVCHADKDDVIFYSLIQPLKYCGDYRPYFTIHDSEYKAYTTKTQPPLVI